MNISNECLAFNRLTMEYLLRATDNKSYIGLSILCTEYEIIQFGKHHAECGENVYIVGVSPPDFEIPKNLKLYKVWDDFIFKEEDHALIVDFNTIKKNKHLYDFLDECFKSFLYITTINTLR